MKKMAKIAGIALLTITQSPAQSKPTTQQAGDCSINDVGSSNQLTIDCRGIGKEQGRKILAILNKILADKIDTDAVMAKLDEILHAVNPNLRKKTYTCRGGSTTEGPTATASFQIDGVIGQDPAVMEMAKLNDALQYRELLQLCTSQIESKPEWLTPRLFCALAYVGTGDTARAKGMLEVYDAGKGPLYDEDAGCQKMSDFLHSKLK